MIFGLTSSSDAIKTLYLSHKEENPKYSLGYICRKSGISSKGYLSDIIHGRRTINLKYSKGIIAAFSLKGVSAQYLKTLIQKDNEIDLLRIKKLTQVLKDLEKESKIREVSVPSSFTEPFFTLEVFCAFGLFQSRPTLQDLLQYFGKNADGKVQRALEALLLMGSISRREDGRYELRERQFIFKDSQDGLRHLEHLEESLEHAKRNVRHFFPKADQSYFESKTVSVSRAKFEKALPHLKRNFKSFVSSLETDDGDELVRFNIQVYPRPQET
jgi:uncharacterized protein (TIGR02147 family)